MTPAYELPLVRRVVTLCGSMRFYREMLAEAAELTARGHVVLAPFVVTAPDARGGPGKAALDELHRVKIDMCDEILVVTDGSDYIGASTRAEIRYARTKGKYLGAHQIRRVTLTAREAVR
jgi:hypothetical protein